MMIMDYKDQSEIRKIENKEKYYNNSGPSDAVN